MYELQCVGNTVNHAPPRLHDIEAISRDNPLNVHYNPFLPSLAKHRQLNQDSDDQTLPALPSVHNNECCKC
jgi:hypothetical protein